MDDAELRNRLDDVQEDVKEMRQMLTGMQVADAQARGDLKVVVGKLDNSANALADAAQAIQRSDLARTMEREAVAAKTDVAQAWRKDPVGIALIVLVGIIGVIALGKEGPEIVANIAKAFGLGL